MFVFVGVTAVLGIKYITANHGNQQNQPTFLRDVIANRRQAVPHNYEVTGFYLTSDIVWTKLKSKGTMTPALPVF